MKELKEVLLFLNEKLSDIKPEELKLCDGIRANALVNIYKKTKNEQAGKMILNLADVLVNAVEIGSDAFKETEATSPLIVLFLAFDITADDKYKEKIVALEKSDVYTGLVFDMMYETAFGGKERYHAITTEFNRLNREPRLTEFSMALFLEALIDTIEAINQPVYELYRELVDLFRANCGGLLIKGACPFQDEKANLVFSYAVKKACDMKVLLAEKYEAMAVAVVEKEQKLNCGYSLAYSRVISAE